METVSGPKGEVSCVRRHPPGQVALACVASSRQAVSTLGRSSLTLGSMAMAGFGQKRPIRTHHQAAPTESISVSCSWA